MGLWNRRIDETYEKHGHKMDKTFWAKGRKIDRSTRRTRSKAICEEITSCTSCNNFPWRYRMNRQICADSFSNTAAVRVSGRTTGSRPHCHPLRGSTPVNTDEVQRLLVRFCTDSRSALQAIAAAQRHGLTLFETSLRALTALSHQSELTAQWTEAADAQSGSASNLQQRRVPIAYAAAG